MREALGDHVFERLIEAQRIGVGRLPPARLRLGARSLPRGVLTRSGPDGWYRPSDPSGSPLLTGGQ